VVDRRVAVLVVCIHQEIAVGAINVVDRRVAVLVVCIHQEIAVGGQSTSDSEESHIASCRYVAMRSLLIYECRGKD